jgi:hypothetical protein
MKKRNGFVSNSSSSSFIVIGENAFNIPILNSEVFIIGNNGHTDYGWEDEEYHEMDSRINFALIQSYYKPELNWFSMIIECLKKYYPNSDMLLRLIPSDLYSLLTYKAYEDYKIFELLLSKDFDGIRALEIEYYRDLKLYNDELLELASKYALYCAENGIYPEHKDRFFRNGYIDHQSSAEEGQNIDMFDNIENLEKFLFSNDSYIETGNDNDDNWGWSY